MRSFTARAASLTLAILIAGWGLLPCVCAEMRTSHARSSHCGQAESGLQSDQDGCACVCMRAEAADAAKLVSEPVLAASLWLPVTTPAVGAELHPALTAGATPRPANSPPTSPPLVLRV